MFPNKYTLKGMETKMNIQLMKNEVGRWDLYIDSTPYMCNETKTKLQKLIPELIKRLDWTNTTMLACKCRKCEHEWAARQGKWDNEEYQSPRQCPKCKSASWNVIE